MTIEQKRIQLCEIGINIWNASDFPESISGLPYVRVSSAGIPQMDLDVEELEILHRQYC